MMYQLVYFAFLLASISCVFAINANPPKSTEYLRKCGNVHLTITSLKHNHLELNWITQCGPGEYLPDTIMLFEADPRINRDTQPLVIISAKDYPDGYYESKLTVPNTELPNEWKEGNDLSVNRKPGKYCFPYWIASFRNNRLLFANCLSIYPTWMFDLRNHLKDKRIGNLFIPGTHNSGAHNVDNKTIVAKRYTLNQARSIWDQLVFGIRYFDFRIGHYDEGFTINHDLIKIRPLIPILKTIKSFLKQAPKEVVILDFHRFPYPLSFGNDLHNKLVATIKEELGDLIIPRTGWRPKGPTLDEIWRQNKNVIVSYANPDIVKTTPLLWSQMPQVWGNIRDPEGLKRFMADAVESPQIPKVDMWAMMAHLTPSKTDVVLLRRHNRHLAQDLNKQLSVWVRDMWAEKLNIIASDFFLANDLINIAIEVNIYHKLPR